MPAKVCALLATLLFLPSLRSYSEVEDLRDEPDLVEPGIPEVASQEQLDAIKPDLTFDGWELRLAIAPGAMPKKPIKPEAAPNFSTTPWRILYADFRRVKEGAKFPSDGDHLTGESLGPLEFEFEFKPDELLVDHELMIDKLEMARLLRENSDHYLFAATLPTPGKGTFRVRVFPPTPKFKPDIDGDRKREFIAESIWKQDADIPIRWTGFAKSQYVDLPDLGIPIPDQMVLPYVPSSPKFDGDQSLLPSVEPDKALRKPGDATPIPGMIPTGPDPDFNISLAGSGIAIRLGKPGLADIEDFLVRWWIDDKPVALHFAEIPDREEMEELERLREALSERAAYTNRIPFRIPFALSKAKPDSKIAVQLLHSPTGTKKIPNPHMAMMEELEKAMDHRITRHLRLSNKLEFKLGDVAE